MLARKLRAAAERGRAQRVQDTEIPVHSAPLVAFVQREDSLEHGLHPWQLRDGRPILARRVELTQPTHCIGIEWTDVLLADGFRSEEHTSELQSPCNIV